MTQEEKIQFLFDNKGGFVKLFYNNGSKHKELIFAELLSLETVETGIKICSNGTHYVNKADDGTVAIGYTHKYTDVLLWEEIGKTKLSLSDRRTFNRHRDKCYQRNNTLEQMK